MNKLHVKQGDTWLPVFAHKNGEIITCEHAPEKALPPLAIWASDDLEFFAKKFANKQFSIRYVPRGSTHVSTRASQGPNACSA